MEYIRRTAANPEPDRRKADRRAVAHYQDQARIAQLETVLEEFIKDCEAANGDNPLALTKEWPDLHITLGHARAALKG